MTPASCHLDGRSPNKARAQIVTTNGRLDCISSTFKAVVPASPIYAVTLNSVIPVAARASRIFQCSRRTGQSFFRCGQANQNATKNAPIQRQNDRDMDGT